MKTLYLDLSSGISGDMFLAACIDAGFDAGILKKELSKLKVSGYKLKLSQVNRHHITAQKADFVFNRNASHYSPKEIISLIRRSKLGPEVKEASIKIFSRLFSAEEKVHKKTNIHLHELGHADTILDVVGAGIIKCKWGVGKIIFSNVVLGCGIIRSHTILPNPSPATMELLKGVPCEFKNIDAELITPTGAAIISALGEYKKEPVLKFDRIGYGAGSKIIENIPNALRVLVSEDARNFQDDQVIVIDTAIDDMPQFVYTYLYEELFSSGALDVYVTPVYMKKNRPAYELKVICPEDRLKDIAECIFTQTRTIGLRYYKTDRIKLKRQIRTMKTKYGNIEVKISGAGEKIYNSSPEFESCRRAAKKHKVPFLDVYDAVKKTLMVMALFLGCAGLCQADTLFMKDGSELKGIIVENYTDRVVLSTENGEKEIGKDSIGRIAYDLEEQNYVAMGDNAKAAGNYEKAYYYYEKAKDINPNYKPAIEGAAYLNGYLYRKEAVKKESKVAWLQQVEDFNLKQSVITQDPSRQKVLAELGVELGQEKKRDIYLSKVFEGTPAKRAGLKKNDVIVSVWGKMVGYMTKDAVEKELAMPENLEIKMQIDRGMRIEKNTIKPAMVKLEFEGYILRGIKETTSAFKSGFRDGDNIMSIAGQSIRYTPMDKVVKMLRDAPKEILIRRDVTIWKQKKG